MTIAKRFLVSSERHVRFVATQTQTAAAKVPSSTASLPETRAAPDRQKRQNTHELLDRLQGSEWKAIFGPRRIYEAAEKTDKVLGLSYEQVLQLGRYGEGASSETTPVATPQDLLIVSKIMRRSPPVSDAKLQGLRPIIARKLMYEAAKAGSPDAIFFWSEETLSRIGFPSTEVDEALRMLTSLGQQDLLATEKGPRSPDAPIPMQAKANFLLGNYLWHAADLSKATAQRDAGRARALAHYTRAGEQGHAQAWFTLGQQQRLLGRGAAAKESFQRGHELGSADATFMVAQSLTDKKDAAKQRALWAEAAGKGSLAAAHNLGEVYRKEGQVALAMEYFAIPAKAGVSIAQSNLAELHLQAGQFDEAERWFEQASQGQTAQITARQRPRKVSQKRGDQVADLAKERLAAMRQSQAYNDFQRAKATRKERPCCIM